MRDHINYEPHLRLQREVEQFLSNGGQIKPCNSKDTNIEQYATPKQVMLIKEWCEKERGRTKALRLRVEKRTSMKSGQWLGNILSGNRNCPLSLYGVILEEMEND